jgi:hypothetical protein
MVEHSIERRWHSVDPPVFHCNDANSSGKPRLCTRFCPQQRFTHCLDGAQTILFVSPFEYMLQDYLTASQDRSNIQSMCEEKLATDGFTPVSHASTSKVDLIAALWSLSAVKRVARSAMHRHTEPSNHQSRFKINQVDALTELGSSDHDDELIKACAAIADAKKKYARRLQQQLAGEPQMDREFTAVASSSKLLRLGRASGSTRSLSLRKRSFHNLPIDLPSSATEISVEDWTKVVLASIPSEVVQLRVQQKNARPHEERATITAGGSRCADLTKRTAPWILLR